MRPTFTAIFMLAASSVLAQIAPTDSSHTDVSVSTIAVQKHKFWRRSEWLVPTALIASGSLIALNHWDSEFFLSNQEIHEERDRYFPRFSNGADNYLQIAPAFAVLAMNSCGVRGKNNLSNQIAILIKTELLITAVVTPLKTIVHEPRPDTGASNSFPSGHTTQAFAVATVFAKEYGHKSPWYSVGAYTVATTVGAMRILNNRHWFSDVVAGAGIGILSANLVYATHRHKWGGVHTNPRTGIKKKNEFMVTPTYGYSGNTGVYLSYKF